MKAPATTSVARRLQRAGRPKADTALIEELGELCGGEMRGAIVYAEHGGVAFELRFLPKQQGWVVSVPCRPAGRFRVSPKTVLDRWMEGFVPALSFRSHDPRFDRDFNVHTRDVHGVATLLTKAPGRDAVRAVFERGAHRLHLDGDHVRATVSRRTLGKSPGAAPFLALVETLAPLARAATAFAARRGERTPPEHDAVVVGSWIALGLAGVLGVGMLAVGAAEFPLVDPSPFLVPCALIGLPALIPVVFALALAVQGRSSPYGLVRGLAGVAALVVPFFVSGALLLSNGLFDDGPREERAVRVVHKRAKKQKNELRYHAGLESWRFEDEVRWLPVSKATYEALEPGVSMMSVRTGPWAVGPRVDRGLRDRAVGRSVRRTGRRYHRLAPRDPWPGGTMSTVRAIAAWLLAITLIVFGGNYFVNLFEMPEPQGNQAGLDLLQAMRDGGLMTYVSISHVVAGVFLIIPSTRFAAALFQLHLTLGIVAFHETMLPEGRGIALGMLALNLLALELGKLWRSFASTRPD